MYKAEVLSKLPVAQHFLFGSLLPFPISLEEEERLFAASQSQNGGISTDDHGHIHVRGEMWGDCCGIPVPAAFSEAQVQKQKDSFRVPIGGPRVKRVPFD